MRARGGGAARRCAPGLSRGRQAGPRPSRVFVAALRRRSQRGAARVTASAAVERSRAQRLRQVTAQQSPAREKQPASARSISYIYIYPGSQRLYQKNGGELPVPQPVKIGCGLIGCIYVYKYIFIFVAY